MQPSSTRSRLVASLFAILPLVASAQHDNHGSEQASHGLGQSLPGTKNESLHSAWRIYTFTRDGIAYYQVNDNADRVHFILAKAEDMFWRLPAGSASASILLPSMPRGLPPAAPLYIYRDAEFALVLYDDAANQVWAVEPSR